MKRIKYLILDLLPESFRSELKKKYYIHSLKNFSEKKENDIVIVKKIVKPGDYVVDIGANVGWYTRILSNLVCDNGKVFSIEPVPPTFELLSFCVDKLKLTNVILLNYAISGKEGSAVIEVPKYERGGNNFYRSRIISGNKMDHTLKHYQVGLKSVDSLFSGLSNRISFIKCDVEGHELQVVKGAKTVIANFKPAWLIEISGNPGIKGSDAFEVFRVFEKEGYKPWWFDSKRLKEYHSGDKSTNYFFLTDYHFPSVLEEENFLVG